VLAADPSTASSSTSVSALAASAAPTSENGDLRYRLATTVPDYWLPLVPRRIDPTVPTSASPAAGSPGRLDDPDDT
jgi:hypothetical protein